MNRFRRLFPKCLPSKRPAIIGMIHVKALPGTPLGHLSTVSELIHEATQDASLYQKYQLDGILIENMNDVPYVLPEDSGPETVAIMTRICTEVKKVVGQMPVGVQILAAQNKEALATAQAANCQFIRCESFVFGHVADEGWMNGCAGKLLRYRQSINASDVLIFTDIKKKHASHAITKDVDIGQTARAAEFFLSDGLIVTGTETGNEPNIADIKTVSSSSKLPILVGSGVTTNNVIALTEAGANAVIVGSHFKENGHWSNPLDENRLKDFVNALS